jgi:hypothetical protein
MFEKIPMSDIHNLIAIEKYIEINIAFWEDLLK